MRVGLLTGGGDCPGLNAVIRAVVTVGAARGHEHLGVRGGWKGLMEGVSMPLDPDLVADILPRGGTILGTSRTNPFRHEGGPEACMAGVAGLGLDALVAIGGEDTLGVADRLHRDHGLAVVGVPKTIDNDLSATDYTFGFDTAVQIVSDALDRLRTTAESHDRVIVVEVMGRHAGWIALWSGIAGGADHVLIPERPASVAEVVRSVEARRARGHPFAVVVVSEGVELGDDRGEATERDEFGHRRLARMSVGARLADEVGRATGLDTRAVVLGHLQRGGTPTAYDRILSTRFGVRAAELVDEGRFGQMVALRGSAIEGVPLAAAVAELKTVPDALYRMAEPFFG